MNEAMIGQQVRGYLIEAYVGTGGQGVVYRGIDVHHRRPVALKCIRPENMRDSDSIQRFQIEAEINQRLRHPCIVPMYESWYDGETVWLATAWLNGGSLKARLKHAPLDPAFVLAMLDRIAAALDASHAAQIIHRDVKPDNILFDNADRAWLTDFGTAKRLRVQSITQTGTLVGSPGYHAPEMIQREAITAQADIFSLAVVLYECFAGEHPFASPHLMQMVMNVVQKPMPPLAVLRPDLPPAVDAVLQKAAAKDPDERYATAGALVTALQLALNE